MTKDKATLKVVKKGPGKPEIRDGYLFIAVEGPDIPSLEVPAAKRLAFDARRAHGIKDTTINFDTAGIEVYHTAQPVVSPKTGKTLRYRKMFRITPGPLELNPGMLM